MATCPRCGASVEGSFCPNCGAPVGKLAAATPTLPENVIATLCYSLLIVTGILFLALEPYSRSRSVRFHAYQSIFFFAGMAVLMILTFVLVTIIHVIPWIGLVLSQLLFFGFWLVGLGGWLALMYKAYKGEKLVLPVVGPLADKLANAAPL